MNTQQIEYFLYAAECLSFTKAAEKFYTTQPTISRQISALEKELGVTLFQRDNNMLKLTSSGSVMALVFAKQQHNLAEAIAKARMLEGVTTRSLQIGFLSGINTTDYLVPYVENYLSLYPDTDINCVSGSFSDLRNGLESGDLDVIFTYSFEVRSMEHIYFERCTKVETGFLFSAKSPLAAKKKLTAKDFNRPLFLLPAVKDSEERTSDIHVICSAMGIKDYDIRYLANIESCLFNAKVGRGIAFVSSCMLASNTPEDYCFFRVQYPTPTYYVCVIKSTSTNPAAASFVTGLRTYLNEHPAVEGQREENRYGLWSMASKLCAGRTK